jgi:hypothetical protein
MTADIDALYTLSLSSRTQYLTNFASVTVQIDSMSAVIGGIAVSTRANSSFFSLALTTAVGRDVFNVMNATNSNLNDLQNSSATAFYNTINSTMMAVRTDTATLAGIIRSTMSELADNTNTINGVTNLVSWNSLKDVPAGFADGSDDGGGGGGIAAVDVFDGTSHVATSNTITLRTPYGPASVAGASALITTVTVMGSTNPYRSISIPAGSWIGCGQSSASQINGGFAMTSTATAYNVFGETYHLFENPRSTTQFACASLRMPYEWDGSSVAFQVIWHTTGTSGIMVNKLAGWSLGGISVSSGSSIYSAVTSSATVWSAFSSTNTEIHTPQSSAYQILGTPLPGQRVRFVLNSGGGGFTGLPRMTDVLIWYRESIWDGRLR